MTTPGTASTAHHTAADDPAATGDTHSTMAAPLLAQITGYFSPASAACIASPTGGGLCLYLAVHPRDIPLREPEQAGLRPVAHDDARWAQLAALLARADEHKVIGWVAIFDGAFTQSAGEVGPTGEIQGWRIHEMHSHHLRKLRRHPTGSGLPRVSRTAALSVTKRESLQ